MSASFYDLLKYAKTGIASPGMTAYDKMRALAMACGKVKTLTGVPPLSFRANGKPLISWSMIGNGQQNGTPSPDNIIMPEFCGKLVGTDWIIPITNAGQTTPIYLGQTQTVRRIKKLVLDGTETWTSFNNFGNRLVAKINLSNVEKAVKVVGYCSHIAWKPSYAESELNRVVLNTQIELYFSFESSVFSELTIDGFKSYLSAQYSAGTPVTVWYVLANEQTSIVNEPLCKIGDYADTLHSADAGITIPTTRGSNTLTVDTGLQPSEMTITYR